MSAVEVLQLWLLLILQLASARSQNIQPSFTPYTIADYSQHPVQFVMNKRAVDYCSFITDTLSTKYQTTSQMQFRNCSVPDNGIAWIEQDQVPGPTENDIILQPGDQITPSERLQFECKECECQSDGQLSCTEKAYSWTDKDDACVKYTCVEGEKKTTNNTELCECDEGFELVAAPSPKCCECHPRVTSSESVIAQPSCPNDFDEVPELNMCYKVIKEKLNWSDAGKRCDQIQKGAALAKIFSSNESVAIKNFLRREITKYPSDCLLPHSYGPAQVYWIGGQRKNPVDCKSPWVWRSPSQTDITITYSDWNPGQPDCHLGKETCISIPKEYGFFRWNDAHCSSAICSLCAFPLRG